MNNLTLTNCNDTLYRGCQYEIGLGKGKWSLNGLVAVMRGGGGEGKLELSPEISKIVLTHYHTMPHFDSLKTYSCGKHCEKRRNCLLQAISPFLTMFPP